MSKITTITDGFIEVYNTSDKHITLIVKKDDVIFLKVYIQSGYQIININMKNSHLGTFELLDDTELERWKHMSWYKRIFFKKPKVKILDSIEPKV